MKSIVSRCFEYKNGSKIIRRIVHKKESVVELTEYIGKKRLELENLKLFSQNLTQRSNESEEKYANLQTKLHIMREDNLFACDPFPSVEQYFISKTKLEKLETIHKIVQRKIRVLSIK